MATRGRSRRRGRSRSRDNGRADENGRAAEERSGRRVPELGELSPFSVFCALHLGITETDGFALQDAGTVGRRFGLNSDELGDYLEREGLRAEDLRGAKFDLAGALLDIQVAPEGISRTELARTLFEELRAVLPCEPAAKPDASSRLR